MSVLEVVGKIAVAVAKHFAGDDSMIAAVVRGAATVAEKWQDGTLGDEAALKQLAKLDAAVAKDRELAREELRTKWGIVP